MTGEKLLLLLVGTEGGRFSLRIMHEGTKRKDDNGCRFNSFKIIMKNNADLIFFSISNFRKTTGALLSIERRIREIPEYSGKYAL